jgi:hypothetical protein
VSDPARHNQLQPLPEASPGLEIVLAQYHRAVTRAAMADPAERASALEEARRLVGVAVAVRRRAEARAADGTPAAAPARSATSTLSVDRADMAVSPGLMNA